ncbi:MAG: hypothetical protein IPJ42_19965 [Betaproteobacteria bacterium]|nr:hypothetical protein [Betaproteobacteria bacterium]
MQPPFGKCHAQRRGQFFGRFRQPLVQPGAQRPPDRGAVAQALAQHGQQTHAQWQAQAFEERGRERFAQGLRQDLHAEHAAHGRHGEIEALGVIDATTIDQQPQPGHGLGTVTDIARPAPADRLAIGAAMRPQPQPRIGRRHFAAQQFVAPPAGGIGGGVALVFFQGDPAGGAQGVERQRHFGQRQPGTALGAVAQAAQQVHDEGLAARRPGHAQRVVDGFQVGRRGLVHRPGRRGRRRA